MSNNVEFKVSQDLKEDVSPPASGSHSTDYALDEIEEKKLVRKIDWRLLPILGALYSIALIDRTNVSNNLFSKHKTALSNAFANQYSSDFQRTSRRNGTRPPSRYWRPIHNCLGPFLPYLLPPGAAVKYCAAQGRQCKLAFFHRRVMGRSDDWTGLCEKLDLACYMSCSAWSV